MRLRRPPAALIFPAIALLVGGLAVAQVASRDPAQPRVRHEDLPSPQEGTRRAEVGESAVGSNPVGFAAGDRVLAEPLMDGITKDEPVFGRAGAAAARQTESRPDRQTQADGTLHYVAVFDPDVVPWKRNGTFDTVLDDYTMVLRGRATSDLTVGGQTRVDRDRFWGDIWVELSPGVEVPIPSVAPDMRILSYRTDPAGAPLIFSKDGGDNFYVRADEPSVAGRYHLIFFADADSRYFAPALPQETRLTPRRAAARVPPELRPVLPANVQAAAQRTLTRLRLDPDLSLDVVVNKLVFFFRGFEAKDPPPPSTDIYRDLCDAQAGVCRHRSFAFMVTANALGIPTRFVYNEAHAFVEIWLPERNWQRIDLGGAASRLEIANAGTKSRHVPRAEDPFAKPDAYTQGGTSYSDLQGDVRGLGRQQLDDWRRKPGEATPSGDFDPAENAEVAGDDSGVTAPDPGLPPRMADPKRLTPRIAVTRWDDVGYRGELLRVNGRVELEGSPLPDRVVDLFLAERGGANSVLIGRGVSDATGEFAVECDLPASLDLKQYELYVSTRGDARFNAAISE